MGNTNSSSITLEQFKDHVFGATMLLLAPRLDNELKFVADSTSELTESRFHTLPNVIQEYSKNLLDGCRTYYNSESREDSQALIDRYVNQVILDSKESADAFITLLVRQLNARHKETQDRVHPPNPTPHVETSSLIVNVSTPASLRRNSTLIHPPQKAVTSRTTMKLNRKIQQLDNEIAQQRQIYQARTTKNGNDSDTVTVDDEYQQVSDTEEASSVQQVVEGASPVQKVVETVLW